VDLTSLRHRVPAPGEISPRELLRPHCAPRRIFSSDTCVTSARPPDANDDAFRAPGLRRPTTCYLRSEGPKVDREGRPRKRFDLEPSNRPAPRESPPPVLRLRGPSYRRGRSGPPRISPIAAGAGTDSGRFFWETTSRCFVVGEESRSSSTQLITMRPRSPSIGRPGGRSPCGSGRAGADHARETGNNGLRDPAPFPMRRVAMVEEPAAKVRTASRGSIHQRAADAYGPLRLLGTPALSTETFERGRAVRARRISSSRRSPPPSAHRRWHRLFPPSVISGLLVRRRPPVSGRVSLRDFPSCLFG